MPVYGAETVPWRPKRKSQGRMDDVYVHPCKKTKYHDLPTIPHPSTDISSLLLAKATESAACNPSVRVAAIKQDHGATTCVSPTVVEPQDQIETLVRDQPKPKKEAFEVLLEMEKNFRIDCGDELAEFRKERSRVRDLYKLKLVQSDSDAEFEYLKNRLDWKVASAARLKAQLDANLAKKMKKL